MQRNQIYIDRLRIRHLKLLEMIESHDSLRTIAEVLNTSQPALSQLVRDLENAFDASLVKRSARGVSLTPAGRLALQRVRQAVAALDHLSEELEVGKIPVLRIGTNPVLLHDEAFPTAFANMFAEGATLRYKISSARERLMVQALEDGEIDCYLGIVNWDKMPAQAAANLSYESLGRTPLTIICNREHPLLARDPLPASALLEWQWALQPDGSYHRNLLENAFRSLDLQTPEPVVEVSADPFALVQLIARTEMLSCIPDTTIARSGSEGLVRRLSPADLKIDASNIQFVTLAQNRNFEPLNQLYRHLKATFSPSPGEKVT
ncbi:LysR substrate-binding domain-containing protein [Martelella sp. FLE1502]